MNNEIGIGLFINELLINNCPLIKKFSYLKQLSHDEIDALLKIHEQTRLIEAHKTFLNQGGTQKQSLIITRGWAYRYYDLSNGKRQIINYYLPGDIISPFSSVMLIVNYSVASITPLHVCPFDRDDLTELFTISPKLKPLFEYMLAWEDILLAEQVCRLGRQSAYQRTVHLLLELFHRLKIVGQTERNTFISPLTQQIMAETLGLSIVHMNRTLRKLCNENLISIMAHTVSLLNTFKLKQIAEYPGAYLEPRKKFSFDNDQIEGIQKMHQKASAAQFLINTNYV